MGDYLNNDGILKILSSFKNNGEAVLSKEIVEYLSELGLAKKNTTFKQIRGRQLCTLTLKGKMELEKKTKMQYEVNNCAEKCKNKNENYCIENSFNSTTVNYYNCPTNEEKEKKSSIFKKIITESISLIFKVLFFIINIYLK